MQFSSSFTEIFSALAMLVLMKKLNLPNNYGDLKKLIEVTKDSDFFQF